MHKTLLLCFIHGFKGGEDTFGGFPEHLRVLISHALPNVSVKAITYPKFETRGDLKECVGRFREWLVDVVIDIEVASSTPSPTVDPSVRTVLIGHSMGGIVAADALLSIFSDPPVRPASGPPPSTTTNIDTTSTSAPAKADNQSGRPSSPTNSFMFPYIQGVLAFDTPYLGIAPTVLAYGAETHYKTASSAYSALTSAASALGWGSPSPSPGPGPKPRAALPASPNAASSSTDAAAVPTWQRWGKYAMFAGAAGAVAAGSAAAYWNKETIGQGWGWATSHLEFVGCLMRGEELKTRVAKVVSLRAEHGIGFADLYTVLGKGARKEGTTVAGGWVEIGGKDEGLNRSFCALPKTEAWKPLFEPCGNDKAVGEIEAHVSMFFPRDNPDYYELSERAKMKIVGWVDEGWYMSSEPRKQKENMETKGDGGLAGEEPVIVG